MDLKDEIFTSVLETMGILSEDEDVRKRIWGKYVACKSYLVTAGASEKIQKANLEQTVETVAIGVNDLLNGVPGKTEFSPAFRMLSVHLSSLSESE